MLKPMTTPLNQHKLSMVLNDATCKGENFCAGQCVWPAFSIRKNGCSLLGASLQLVRLFWHHKLSK